MTDLLGTILILTPIFLGTFFRSTFGFGDALIAMPLLALVVPLDTARPLVALISTTVAAVIACRDWRNVHFASAWRLALWGVLGVPLGFLLIGSLDEDVVKIILALLVTGYAAYCLASRQALVLKTNRTAPLFGLVSGLLCGAYNTGGPPLVVYGTAQGWEAVKFRATLQGVFFPISLSIVSGHALVGNLSEQVLWFFLWSLPVMFVAIMLGRGLNKRIGYRHFLVYVYWLLILIGIVLFIDSARGLHGKSTSGALQHDRATETHRQTQLPHTRLH